MSCCYSKLRSCTETYAIHDYDIIKMATLCKGQLGILMRRVRDVMRSDKVKQGY